ncbi:hypothetical protein [Streptomyces sp. NPDC029674]|uniref:hypothetical protein n=1 Tax=Streptomyces sp. NPDC029674 TaxID=3365297 RepID=UPI0038515C44
MTLPLRQGWNLDGARPRYVKLVASRVSEASPAWQRIVETLARRAERRAEQRSGRRAEARDGSRAPTA